MKMTPLVIFFACTACLILGNSALYAESKSLCNLDEQLGIIYHEADIARGRLAEQQIEVLNQIQGLWASRVERRLSSKAFRRKQCP